ncbi:MAG TPA: dihydrolipoamide acetyltransferase family protein [Terriglobales bacterium]|nr:dihydrolipoamide acetyltransferase family protein [Terriglobales bacterium]
MAISVVMPALEMAQETGKLVSWRKKEGDSVAKGEPLLEVETDKAIMEIEAPGDGVLAGIKVQEGDVVPVGQTIAWIVRPGESPPPEVAASATGRQVATEPTRRPAVAAQAPQQPAGAGPKISPKARRLAREHGVDLNSLRGSGPDGAIVTEDVLAAVESTRAPINNLQKLGPVGRLMAERTTASWTTVPHFFVVREVDASPLVQAREKFAPRAQGRPSLTDLLVALVARVLTKHPRINASWSPEGIRLNPEINVAVAIAVDEGVVAAVIHGADKMALFDITAQRQDLTERARAGRLRPAEIAGATFTLSNLGMYDVDAFSAIIASPQAAILAVGRIADRVVPILGKPVVRPMMTMTLSCDHRVADGAKAALFLNDLAAAICEPEKWLN